MKPAPLFLALAALHASAHARIGAVDKAMDAAIASREIAGAVTLVADRDKVLPLGTHGLAAFDFPRDQVADDLLRGPPLRRRPHPGFGL